MPAAKAATAKTLPTIDCFIGVLPPCDRVSGLRGRLPPAGPSRQPRARRPRPTSCQDRRHDELPPATAAARAAHSTRSRRPPSGRHPPRAVPGPERHREELAGAEGEILRVRGLERASDDDPVLTGLVERPAPSPDRFPGLRGHLAHPRRRRLADVLSGTPRQQVDRMAPIPHEEVRTIARSPARSGTGWRSCSGFGALFVGSDAVGSSQVRWNDYLAGQCTPPAK